jgi:hypothetical protein
LKYILTFYVSILIKKKLKINLTSSNVFFGEEKKTPKSPHYKEKEFEFAILRH